jgi:molybdopterin/thiamine biosynthesis adenylyltransferase/rhodanese-related sulfurtransferase
MTTMNGFLPYGRYHHQINLSGFGETSQRRLLQARVLVAGAGGLGCAALQYLAAAGVGTIGIADDDVVRLSNLHRQVLYTVNDIGSSKAECAARWLRQLNPEIDIHVHAVRLTVRNIIDIIRPYDIILDGTDNLGSKYMINDACILSGKPVVFAAISQFEGQVAVFNLLHEGIETANYRDVFPIQTTSENESPCNETGVLGVLPGIIGALQCNETIKVITGVGKPLVNSLLTYNALTNQVHEFSIQARKENRLLVPNDIGEFMGTIYDQPCATQAQEQFELHAGEFSSLINKELITVIDVREPYASHSPADFQHIRIPYRQLQEKLGTITGDTIVTFCEHGIISLQAARLLKDAFGDEKRIFSLNKGISHWNLSYRKTKP